MSPTINSSPFHDGELAIQAKMGVKDHVASYASRVVRDHMPEQHRQFFAQLPLLFVGSIDGQGRPWASVLFGEPGFIGSLTPKRLTVHARSVEGDPLEKNLIQGASLGLLGLEYHSRRRNRLNGEVVAINQNGFELQVSQSFGNCPQFIQARTFERLRPGIRIPQASEPFRRLDSEAISLITNAMSFYIASYYDSGPGKASAGADVSHRGGKRGFVKVLDDQTLVFPDFSGNNHFNTLGNIHKNPVAGLLFIDFDSGDLLSLTCSAKMVWDSPDLADFEGAQRLVEFKVQAGVHLKRAMQLAWTFLEPSPHLARVGSWETVALKQSARQRPSQQSYRVYKIVEETATVKSFYLAPVASHSIPTHRAGQFLPLQIQLPGIKKTITRPYTISCAPNGKYLRITVKREKQPEGPSVSQYLHDQIKIGFQIEALGPRGRFLLPEKQERPMVFLSAGVGITPMISMLEALAEDEAFRQSQQPVWWIHGARDGQSHIFKSKVQGLTQKLSQLTTHYSYSKPSTEHQLGQDFDHHGRIETSLLKTILPFDDFDFFICGPNTFMKSLYAGLTAMTVSPERIHYEFFGKGERLEKPSLQDSKKAIDKPDSQESIPINFAKSEVTTHWNAGQGTLLDLAEANGLRPSFGCRAGICETCKTKCSSGKVTYSDPSLPPPSNGEILLCVAQPDPTSKKPIVLDL